MEVKRTQPAEQRERDQLSSCLYDIVYNIFIRTHGKEVRTEEDGTNRAETHDQIRKEKSQLKRKNLDYSIFVVICQKV